MKEKQLEPNRFIRLKDVIHISGLSKSSIYDKMKTEAFPKSIPLGGRSVAWVETEVYAWVNKKILVRDGMLNDDDN
ncbi:hypothetical protein BCT06_12690 [Vibrio breoganii]|uniref:AlpA family transcriptional regulator n=1 Tax=Vibrio breoganii TaxID=553239 RepID=UPI000C854113|nr:AlpA family transcriptional regulator [Vibrio breoganii]PMO60347.1 hypothetical protein BCT06_12690 [Vibrio breoganii]